MFSTVRIFSGYSPGRCCFHLQEFTHVIEIWVRPNSARTLSELGIERPTEEGLEQSILLDVSSGRILKSFDVSPGRYVPAAYPYTGNRRRIAVRASHKAGHGHTKGFACRKIDFVQPVFRSRNAHDETNDADYRNERQLFAQVETPK